MDNKFSLEEDGFQHYLGHFNERTPTSFIHHGDIKLEDMYSFQSFTANNQVTIAEISNTGIAANNPTSNSIETNYFASTSSGAPTTSWIPSITTRAVLNNGDVPDDVENLSLCSSSQITPNNSSEAHQTQVRSSRRKKKNKCMNDDECKKFVDDLLHRVNDGKLRKGELQKLAEIYGVSRWTAQRVWGRVKESLRTGVLASVTYRRKGRCGRKPMEFDISKLVSVPLDQRCNLRILAEALGTNKSTVHRFVKRHNMSIKPSLVERLHPASSKVLDYSGPYTIQALLDNINSGMYGSLTKEVEAVVARKLQELYPSLFDPDENLSDAICNVNEELLGLLSDDVFEVESVEATSTIPSNTELLPHNFLVNSHVSLDNSKEERKVGKVKDKGTFVGVDDVLSDEDRGSTADDEESDIWREMNFALESSKDPIDQLDDKLSEEEDEGCDHSYVLKDDIGYVCRVCGVIQKAIETIFDFQYIKAARVGSYRCESRSTRKIVDTDVNLDGAKLSGPDLAVNEISPHPRHKKHMKPHQLEGFNFLLSNLIAESPGGCILAHAPGSGKTFIIISFIQSFMAQYPNARPLVVLPKGILSTWKKEFQRWQVEDIPLLDFYSVRAESRVQQKEVLKLWMEKRSILFLGYMQFSSIISDDSSYKTNAYCQEILLKLPTLLILDEGHTPRNENTDVLNSLAKVQTPRKVVLSGTLYQNHVKEVFTILNLVRPKFLRLDTSRSIKSRILSRVQFHGYKKQLKGSNVENNFFDLVEYTLQQEEDWKRKEAVIKDLREMTSKVLHYYRGDFLDDLPGLVDFTVFLSLSPQQKTEVDKLKKREKMKFRKTSLGCTVYTHPMLKQFSDSNLGNEKLPNDISKIDELVERIDIRDGVKAKFFLNMLALCESAGEKLLVFSQYLLPLKFLERLCVYRKGWIIGKEIFMIVGDTSTDQRELHMERFNNSSDARVLFGSIKACGEGISLVGASRIIILDVHLNPSVSRQAVGRAFRPGQEKKVFAYRLVAADSPEEEDHLTCLKKEQISKRWFEWDEYRGSQDFKMELVAVKDADDLFLESPCLAEDVKALHRR